MMKYCLIAHLDQRRDKERNASAILGSVFAMLRNTSSSLVKRDPCLCYNSRSEIRGAISTAETMTGV